MEEERPKKKTQILPVLKDYFTATTHYPWLFTFCLIGGLGIEAASVIAPLFLKQFIDLLATGLPTTDTVHALTTLLFIFGGISLIAWFVRRVRDIAISYLEANVMTNLSENAFSYLIRHSHDFFISNFVGTLTRRVTRYARSYEQVLDSIIMNFLPTFLFATGVIVILYLRHPLLGISLIVWTVLSVILQLWLAGMVQPYRMKRAAEDSKVTGTLSDSISNHSSVSLFAAEKQEIRTFTKVLRSWRQALLNAWNTDQWVWGIQGFFAIFIEVGLLFGAVYAWKAGILTVGDFVLIQIYIIGLIDRLWGIGQNMRRLYEAFADAYEMIEIFQTPHAVSDNVGAKALAVSGGKIEFNNISFWFEKDRPVLKDFNLTIAAGEKTALVGPSGAGKSTITKLLLRLYDSSEGAVLIDGMDIKQVTQESLREAIAFVPQEPTLFHRTLMENIRYGRDSATDEEVWEAAKKAHCHEFIQNFPQKYDTFVGERGVKLSGGERQRVAIARAILKNAPILVLDEATSSLDSESEALIQDALRTLMEGKTVIVIAHRLSTIMRMDRIIVIEGGKLAASGTHADLVKHKGSLYEKLWSIQAGGFLEE